MSWSSTSTSARRQRLGLRALDLEAVELGEQVVLIGRDQVDPALLERGVLALGVGTRLQGRPRRHRRDVGGIDDRAGLGRGPGAGGRDVDDDRHRRASDVLDDLPAEESRPPGVSSRMIASGAPSSAASLRA